MWSAWILLFVVASFHLFCRLCVVFAFKTVQLICWIHCLIVDLYVTMLWKLLWRRHAYIHGLSRVFSNATITVLCGKVCHQSMAFYCACLFLRGYVASWFVVIMCELGLTLFVNRKVYLRLLKSISLALCVRANITAIAEFSWTLIYYTSLLHIACPIFKGDMKLSFGQFTWGAH